MDDGATVVPGRDLSCAVPDHPEFRRYSRTERGDVVVVCPDASGR